jgi:hypothetical protein
MYCTPYAKEYVSFFGTLVWVGCPMIGYEA